MNGTTWWRALAALTSVALVMAACTGAPATQAPTQAPTEAPTQAPTQAATQAPTQTATEAPTTAPTDTAEPIGSPEPTGTAEPTGSPEPTASAACALTTNADGLREVTAYLPLPVPVIAMFPFVVGEGAGFFAEEGLAVSLEPTDSSTLIVQQMSTGRGEAGWIVSGTVMSAFAQDQALVAVHEFLVQPVFQLIVPADSDVQSYADLRGRDVGVENAAGGDIAELRATLAAAGLQPGVDVNLIPLGEDMSTVWPRVESGEVAAFNISYNNRVNLEFGGIEFRSIDPPVDPTERRPSVPLVVQRSLVEDCPDVVVGLGRGLNKAIVFAHANPDPALAIQKEAFPPEHESEEFARFYMDQAIAMSWIPEGADEETWLFGEQSLEGWEDLQTALIEATDIGGIEEDFDLIPYVTNEFIPAMNDFDREAVEQQAQESELTYP